MFIPYLLAVLGIVSDWVTTQIGLSRGFYETHDTYSPLWAFLIFVGVLAFLDVVLGDFKYKQVGMSAIACICFLGAANNILVLTGVFGGLVL